MRLQQFNWHVAEDIDKGLYYRVQNDAGDSVNTTFVQDILLNAKEKIVFDTYFHSFSIKKWKRYTDLSQFSIKFSGVGTIQFDLYGAWYGENGVEKKRLVQQTITMKPDEEYTIPIPETDCDICYPVVECTVGNCRLQAMAYDSESSREWNDISLAIDICTFKREKYLQRNVLMLEQQILKNANSLLYNKVDVYISDNAGTLGDMFEEIEHVHVTPNENVGGVGGFTRGMIEAMECPDKQYTHILIMDDDAIIEPLALERTYTLLANLKEEYRDATIGGALLRENTPHVQFESGAEWNRGRIKAHHHHIDLREFDSVLANEVLENVEYTGWWYTVVPVKQIREVGLPLPLFIHRDDIEYGIRAGRGKFILLNGIAVWHEAFENKMPGATEYYDLRNMAIINSIHYSDYSVRELKYFLTRWVVSNIVRYRYEYVAMNIKGIEDFCKGIDWLKSQDGQLLHQSIMQMNYKAKPAVEYIGYEGISEEDIQWKNLEQVHERNIGRMERIFKRITFNGAMLPAKGVKVVRPHGNLYDIYRMKEVLYVDSAGNGLLLKRDPKKARECFRMLRKTMKLLDVQFEQAKVSYATRYGELTELSFWKQYLKMDVSSQ